MIRIKTVNKIENPVKEKMAYPNYYSSTVRLPIYAGYTKFAVWPSPQMEISCYGLLDVDSILNPVQTGQWAEFPFLPGCIYAAYRANENTEVRLQIKCDYL